MQIYIKGTTNENGTRTNVRTMGYIACCDMMAWDMQNGILHMDREGVKAVSGWTTNIMKICPYCRSEIEMIYLDETKEE